LQASHPTGRCHLQNYLGSCPNGMKLSPKQSRNREVVEL
jgi:hypothetical protein